MSRSQTRARAPGGRSAGGFGSPAARTPFGGFSSSSGSRLSYLSEPPDLTAISDANVVVSFKNLGKKDGMTKTKALDDLVSYTQAHPHEQDGGVEEAILEAWVQLYPRVAIDNARRVRELAHALQLDLMRSARKRMERRLPRVIGTWLAGTFEKDRAVARAAADGLKSFLNTDEKLLQLWKKCQAQILEYATEAVEETPDTLSDERSTNPDDAEAKYYRVIGGSLALVQNLLVRLDAADTERLQEGYDKFLSVEAVWANATAKDNFVRKTVFQLLETCLEKRAAVLGSQVPRLSKIFVSEAPKSSQAGSAQDFVKVLGRLTERYPEIWSGRKEPLSRLRGLVEKGSQAGTGLFWRYLAQLIASVPQKAVGPDLANDLLRAMRTGISSRDESPVNAVDAWTCYLSTARRLLDLLEPKSALAAFVEANAYPLTQQYLHPDPARSLWAVRSPLSTLPHATLFLAKSSHEELRPSLAAEWARLAQDFISRMSNSLPEVSKDYQKSQQAVADEGSRWFSLVGAIEGIQQTADRDGGASLSPTRDPSIKVLHGALELLKKRNYKPFGAARVIEAALTHTPAILESGEDSFVSSIFPTEHGSMQVLVSSSSFPYLMACLNATAQIPGQLQQFEATWKRVVEALLARDSDEMKSTGILTATATKLAPTALSHDSAPLQEYLRDECLRCARGTSPAWPLLESVFVFGTLTKDNTKQLVTEFLENLGDPRYSPDTLLRALEIVARKAPELISQDEGLHLALVTKLLSLTEVSDGMVSARATALRRLVDTKTNGEPSLYTLIQENLETASPRSLEIETLVEQALSIANAGTVPLESLFPNTNVWMAELAPFLQSQLNPSLSLTSALGGACFLADGAAAKPDTRHHKRGRDGSSIPARMAMYTNELLGSDLDLTSLPQKYQVELMFLQYLVTEMAADQITLMDNAKLWMTLSRPDVLTGVEHFVSSSKHALHAILSGAEGNLVDALIDTMVQQTRELTPAGVYSARALSEVLQALTEAHGLRQGEGERLARLDIMKATPSTVLGAVAILAGYGEALSASKTVHNLCNRLVSDIAGATPQAPKTLASLVLLNACMSTYEMGELPVANNRLVFAVRQITTWLGDADELDSRVSAESCRALQRLLPCVKDVYGPYWERTIEFCIHLWNDAAKDDADERLPYIHASLKLMATLDGISEPNDDLEDAVASFAQAKSQALIELLNLRRDAATSTQPAEIVDALLCRQVEKIPLTHIRDLSDLYGLVASDSRAIQTAAFDLLHKALPAAAEQLSLDVLLDTKDARLPDELLSLLLDAPTLEAYPEEILVKFPTPIRGYLLAWHLIFDAYSKASSKVRDDYTENLKTANYVGPLMEFTFDVLGHSAAKPLKLDKERFTTDHITSYDVRLAESEPEERNMQWLLVHLFYRTLKYTPGLFKAWYIDCRSKQTKIAVEGWLARFFSPTIISEALDEVAAWAEAQEAPADADETQLIVKVSKPAKEVTAGYEVDELTASIAIRIPPSYPLESVSVVGINRVAVNEKKWQSWLMATQGVIIFSNGSIIDGLTAFRRNVIGALKGQTECAICYSIISSDRKMPDKKCTTCRNLFHRTCLYKWFQSSNQNTCPLCRNPIDYLGLDSQRRRQAAAEAP